MIRDITIGQYFPGKSAIHKMDPRIKILLSILYIVMLFVADNMWGLLLGVLFGFAAYLISRIPLSMIWKSMKPVVPIVIFTAVLNLFLSTGGSSSRSPRRASRRRCSCRCGFCASSRAPRC